MTVSQDSTQLLNFMLEEKRDGIFCVSPVLVVDETPVAITNGEFSGVYKKGSVAKLTFSGKFVSPTAAAAVTLCTSGLPTVVGHPARAHGQQM